MKQWYTSIYGRECLANLAGIKLPRIDTTIRLYGGQLCQLPAASPDAGQLAKRGVGQRLSTQFFRTEFASSLAYYL